MSAPKKQKLNNTSGEAVAVHYSGASPLDANQFTPVYHQFSHCPPIMFRCGEEATTIRLLHNDGGLYVLWELEGPQTEAETVSCCIAVDGGTRFVCVQMNAANGTVTTTQRSSDSSSWLPCELSVTARVDQMAVGCGAAASPVPTAAGFDAGLKRVISAAIDPSVLVGNDLEISLVCARRFETFEAYWPSDISAAKWSDLSLAQFGRVSRAVPGSAYNNACSAARLVRPNMLKVVPSPRPTLDDCPAGSILVQAKYVSVCGSDMPYFKADEFKAPSCYWDRDGFCGHEVVGFVVKSKSDKFAEGDPVLSLPSSYFKAHAGSKNEWYVPEIHDVLLEPFPVRGGFCQLFTSHELYSYKIKQCIPKMLAAQGLGTILRMARKVGSVLGKTVVVIGQGQNGLMAARMMSQMCAKTLIAVEPLEYRRKLATQFGAHHAVAPEDALELIHSLTNGRGADVVLEMAGHQQATINAALDYVRCSGTVVAFGVPDDTKYDFEYSKFFRKNVVLMASVIPDPGIDFGDAVHLIENGQFNTDLILTHTFTLDQVQEAFRVASNYLDGVVKLVVELPDLCGPC